MLSQYIVYYSLDIFNGGVTPPPLMTTDPPTEGPSTEPVTTPMMSTTEPPPEVSTPESTGTEAPITTPLPGKQVFN